MYRSKYSRIGYRFLFKKLAYSIGIAGFGIILLASLATALTNQATAAKNYRIAIDQIRFMDVGHNIKK